MPTVFTHEVTEQTRKVHSLLVGHIRHIILMNVGFYISRAHQLWSADENISILSKMPPAALMSLQGNPIFKIFHLNA